MYEIGSSMTPFFRRNQASVQNLTPQMIFGKAILKAFESIWKFGNIRFIFSIIEYKWKFGFLLIFVGDV